MTVDLFADHTPPPGEVAMLGPSARVLRGFALPRMDARGRSKPGPGLQPGWEPPQAN